MRVWRAAWAVGWVGIVPGYGEHSGRYQALADWLSARGWSVAAFDLRGHGKSAGQRGHIRRFTDYLSDVLAFLEELRREREGLPLALLGHSMGGLVVVRFAELYPDRVQGVILSAPFFGLVMPVPTYKRALGRLAARLWPALSLPNGIDPTLLSHDPKVVEAYRTDPLVHRVATARWFTEVQAAQAAALEDAARLTAPLLVLLGEADGLASVSATRRFFVACGSEDKALKLYEGFFHEVLNEAAKGRVWQDLLSWLSSWLGRLESSGLQWGRHEHENGCGGELWPSGGRTPRQDQARGRRDPGVYSR